MRILDSAHFLRPALLLLVGLSGVVGPPPAAGAGYGYGESPSFSLDTTALSNVPVPDQSPACILAPCFPNPFNPRTNIVYELDRSADVDLAIYDLLGRLVRVIQNDERVGEGRHVRAWDGLNETGRPVAGGVYLCRIRAGSTIDSQRITLVK